MTPRVLLVIDSLVPGGAERSTVALLPLLAARGFELEVAVLHGDRPGLHDEARAAGAVVHDLSGPNRRVGGRVGWARQLRELIAERQPDLVHTSLFEADLTGRVAAASRRVPVVSTLATEHYGPAHLAAQGSAGSVRRAKVRAAQVADAASARLTRRLHAVSAHVADTMAVHLRYPRHRIDVVHRGRPASLADAPVAGHREHVRASLGVDDRLVVLMLARHESAKGIDRMLQAFPAVQAADDRAVLLVAGRDGQQSSTLRAEAERLGTGAVRFLGHRDDVADLLAAADVFALPSRREGLPGSLLEAMAAGTPAVASDLPQIREVAPDDEAELVDADDPAALAAAVTGILADPGRAMAMAIRARQRFLNTFTLDRAADGMAAFYHRSMGSDG